MNCLFEYFKGVWNLRFFWVHLALSDLKSKWRHSFLGIAWCILQPLGMTLLLSIVFSRLFNSDISSYGPYIFSGVIIWEFVLVCVTGGSTSFIQAGPYIKQCKHPLAIYTLRTVVSSTIILCLTTIPLCCWTLIIMPQNLDISWFSLLTVYPILLLMFWPLATLLAYVATRFRDATPALSLLMQVLWFISPVYFEEKMFRSGGLSLLVDYNPIYHILQLIRAPVLLGEFPTFENYLGCIVTFALLSLIALAIGVKFEKKVIFYL